VAHDDWLAEQFEEHRAYLRGVAYRMLGSPADADDAVQSTWLRASGADAAAVANLRSWLTTIVARVCLNMLRSRHSHREQSLEDRLPDPIVTADDSAQPEEQAILADSVGLALLVILDTLEPTERLAFVLHDVFQLPFGEIASLIERSPPAARQLASRARRRVSAANVVTPDTDRRRQREVVDAFFAAARSGDFDRLVAVLDPEVVLRADFGRRHAAIPALVRGPASVAGFALTGARLPDAELIPVLINGLAGVLVTVSGRPFSLMGFVAVGGRIAEIDAIADSRRVARLAREVLSKGGDSRQRKRTQAD
jgi:RNA polymerase sigma-70 factor (ECF subfamily)